jgi:hypothetical protein
LLTLIIVIVYSIEDNSLLAEFWALFLEDVEDSLEHIISLGQGSEDVNDKLIVLRHIQQHLLPGGMK